MNLKKTELCKNETLGLSLPSISKFSRGEPVDGKILLKLCEFFDCQPGDILEYVKEESPKPKKKRPKTAETELLSVEQTPEPVERIRSGSPVPEEPAQERKKRIDEEFDRLDKVEDLRQKMLKLKRQGLPYADEEEAYLKAVRALPKRT